MPLLSTAILDAAMRRHDYQPPARLTRQPSGRLVGCQVNPWRAKLVSVPHKSSSANLRQRTLSTAPLSHAEAALWHAWIRASDSITSGIARAVGEATGLSGADYAVLSRLVELGRGTLRQQELANAMHWQKSRLSHHLSRMERRKLVRREQAKTNVVQVVISAAGRRAVRAAEPVQALAIRAHLLSKVAQADRRRLFELLTRLQPE